jgi:hypothetical protein
MRTILTLGVLAALSGCAIIINPNDGELYVESAFGSATAKGNGELGTERREVGNLAALDVQGPLQVQVQVQAGAPSLEIEADKNLLPLIHTEDSANGLKIWIEGNIRTRNPIRVKYTTPQLHQIQALGSGRISVTGLNGGPLRVDNQGSRTIQLAGNVSSLYLKLLGSGNLNANALNSDAATVNLNGSSRVKLGPVRGEALDVAINGSGSLHTSGAVSKVKVSVNGSGDADLSALTSQVANLSVTGSGDISVAVSETLVADTTGSGSITVHGNPAKRSISGKHISVIQ